jgi:hypothetical protein
MEDRIAKKALALEAENCPRLRYHTLGTQTTGATEEKLEEERDKWRSLAAR